MSRIPLVQEKNMTAEQREQFDRFPSNLTRGLLLTEGRLSRALPNLANALRSSGLDPKIREGAILRVASLCNSAYERMQHEGQALKSGWSHTELDQIEAGDFSRLPVPFPALFRFVDECVTRTRVSDETFSQARNTLSDRDVATLVLLVGHYMMVARFIATLEIELDDEPDDWSTEH
ncbi:carboxymuconolactone decarboxylase family protein [Paraburkholderia flava]|uniref:carboxymuconolactone decarboxylase family protein n=1 Tax=Paraburkholderia flava TaxID=2547393 RepID=UPI0010610D5C|nr:carboxymuconolactone decarboxylase family protein [Paraburkholderia flava]